jgi:hypothetical protein
MAWHAVESSRLAEVGSLLWLFSLADRARLLACGDPLPGAGPFTVYRGVAGHGPARRVCGYSWIEDIEIARWFARRSADAGDPAIFRTVVEASEVLAYLHEPRGRSEREILIYPPSKVVRVERVVGENTRPPWATPDEMLAEAEGFGRDRRDPVAGRGVSA